MSKPRKMGISVVQGASKNVKFAFTDKPDLRAATITMTIKRHSVDSDSVLVLSPDINLSPNLQEGEFVIKITSANTTALTPRSYKYELKIVVPSTGQVSIPVIGDFKVFNSLS